jgi:hypothetical protein
VARSRPPRGLASSQWPLPLRPWSWQRVWEQPEHPRRASSGQIKVAGFVPGSATSRSPRAPCVAGLQPGGRPPAPFIILGSPPAPSALCSGLRPSQDHRTGSEGPVMGAERPRDLTPSCSGPPSCDEGCRRGGRWPSPLLGRVASRIPVRRQNGAGVSSSSPAIDKAMATGSPGSPSEGARTAWPREAPCSSARPGRRGAWPPRATCHRTRTRRRSRPSSGIPS